MIEERIITNKNLLYPELNYQIKRSICTNDRKPFIVKLTKLDS